MFQLVWMKNPKLFTLVQYQRKLDKILWWKIISQSIF